MKGKLIKIQIASLIGMALTGWCGFFMESKEMFIPTILLAMVWIGAYAIYEADEYNDSRNK